MSDISDMWWIIDDLSLIGRLKTWSTSFSSTSCIATPAVSLYLPSTLVSQTTDCSMMTACQCVDSCSSNSYYSYSFRQTIAFDWSIQNQTIGGSIANSNPRERSLQGFEREREAYKASHTCQYTAIYMQGEALHSILVCTPEHRIENWVSTSLPSVTMPGDVTMMSGVAA